MSLLKLPKFIVVPDSNALYAKEVPLPVSNSFQHAWEECSKLTSLQLLVPDLVVKELIFQKISVARKALDNAKKNLGTIASIVDSPPPKLHSESHIKQRSKVRLEKWISQRGGKVIKTPLPKIKWSRVVEDSVWRVPPFSLPSDDDHDTEKGFRDYLIMETFLEVSRSHPNEMIVFISGDGLLRETVTCRIKGNDKRLVQDSIKGFLSYLKLLNEDRTKAFAAKVTANVGAAFYSPNNSNCAWVVLKVPDTISNTLGFNLNFPQEKPIKGLTNPFSIRPRIWKSSSEDKYFLGETSYESAPGEKVIWRTRVQVVRMFIAEPDKTNPWLANFDTERLRVTTIDIKWAASLSENAEFSDFEFKACEMVDNQLEIPSPQRRAQFGFPVASNVPGVPLYTAPQ